MVFETRIADSGDGAELASAAATLWSTLAAVIPPPD
jgi:hypothetical protein